MLTRSHTKVASNDIDAFGRLCEDLETVTGVLARYSIIEQVHATTLNCTTDENAPLLRQAILKTYAAILSYLNYAANFLAQKQRFVRNMFRDLETVSLNLTASIEKADSEVLKISDMMRYNQLTQTHATAQNRLASLLQELSMPLQRMSQDISRISDHLDQQARKKVLCWLSMISCEEHLKSESKRILDGTGNRLFQHRAFVSWQNSSWSEIFHLSGIPGAGKSKLTANVAKKFLDQQEPKHPVPIGFFACSRKGDDRRQESVQEVLLAILRQLSSRSSKLPLRGNVVEEYHRRKEEADERGGKPPRLDVDEAIEGILNIAELEPVIIIIDALDELDYHERNILLEGLYHIISAAANVTKIFVSSRRDGDIVDKLRDCVGVEINEELNKKDIDAFIEHEIDKNIKSRKILRGKVSTSLRNEIVTTLSAKAQGM